MARTRRPNRLEAFISRLIDPQDVSIAWKFATFLLICEAALCSAIILKVPCKFFCNFVYSV